MMDNLSMSYTSYTCSESHKVLLSWDNNCAATDATNGVDARSSVGGSRSRPRRPRGGLSRSVAGSVTKMDLPSQFLPTLQPINGSSGMVESFILPGNKTGVVRAIFHPSVLRT
jgi:hypothetical protein